MFNFDKLTWFEMQDIKKEAYEKGEINIILFIQNEQIMKKLTDILFTLKEKNV